MPKTRAIGRNWTRGFEAAPPWASAIRLNGITVTALPRSFHRELARRTAGDARPRSRRLLSGDCLRPAQPPPPTPRHLPGDGDGGLASPTLQPREPVAAG